jgi:hypothetical protein
MKALEVMGWFGQPPLLFIELLHNPNLPLDILPELFNSRGKMVQVENRASNSHEPFTR